MVAERVAVARVEPFLLSFSHVLELTFELKIDSVEVGRDLEVEGELGVVAEIKPVEGLGHRDVVDEAGGSELHLGVLEKTKIARSVIHSQIWSDKHLSLSSHQ